MLTNQLEVFNVVGASDGLINPLNKGDKIIFAASKNESINTVHFYQASVAGDHGSEASVILIEDITLIEYKLKDAVELDSVPTHSIGDESSFIHSNQIIEIVN
ncbi:hypothetical protein JZM10_02815 [Providencia rettgeri]|uniref:hypothetical protein n=1 Tax=Providencia rettgeri TaxID=587 RepID=UPI001980F02F|nr:hypothetical protein [Providencia rettgeri]MBN6350398.1 hypothetical protein [Providencia rettgeri]